MNLQGAGGEGAGGTLVWSAVLWGVAVPLAAIAVAAVAYYAWRGRREHLIRSTDRAVERKSITVTLVTVLPLVAAAALSLTGAIHLSMTIQLAEYVAREDLEPSTGTSLMDYYVAPIITSEPTEPKNLVLIYLESIEDALGDSSMFEINMLESLEVRTEDWDTIEGLQTYVGGGWTITGVVSSQCGVPVKMPSSSGGISPNKWEGDSYLPGATCLGDLLAERGYTGVFLGGADSSFAGKGRFLLDHGFESVKDREYWISQGETEFRADWGLSDGALIENAKAELLALQATGSPFFLSLLTLDTHEYPYFHPYCEQTTDVALTSVTRCSMKAVADLLDFLEDQGFLDNTVVVITGDHTKILAQENAYFEELSSLKHRSIFNRIWAPEAGTIQAANVDQIQLFPTILEAMGFQIKDSRAGIAVSAYSASSPEGSIRGLTSQQYDDLLSAKNSQFYDWLWSESPEEMVSPD